MPPKKGEPPSKSSNRIRFIMLDADISDGNLSELTHAITNALKPSGNFRVIQSPSPVKTITGTDPVEDVEESVEDPIEAEVEETTGDGSPQPKAAKAPRQKKPKPPTYLHDLIKDIDAFKAFAKEKAPESKNQQYLVAAYWLKEYGNCPTVDADKVYTCYKTAEWPSGFNDWAQTFHNLVFTEHIRKVGKGEFAINPTGEEVVKTLNKV